jgi:hypothetical protein
MGDAAEKLTVSNVPRIQLNDGARIPQLWWLPGGACGWKPLVPSELVLLKPANVLQSLPRNQLSDGSLLSRFAMPQNSAAGPASTYSPAP